MVKQRWSIVWWGSGAWVLPVLAAALWALPAERWMRLTAAAVCALLAPVPALVAWSRERRQMQASIAHAQDAAEQLKLQLETVRYRTSRLREELKAADKQARLSHQLTLLGQFTAGFMHEFNNPLAIVTGRLEVLQSERNGDVALCADIAEMLKETQYMSNIARTLLQALRRERAGEVFDASDPRQTLEETTGALRQSFEDKGVELHIELAEAPRVDVPEHVVGEVVRGLLTNALRALEGRDQPTVWARLEPYRTAGAKVSIRIEDNGPGVPEAIRAHLFEPFVTQSSGSERLGLGLFLAASLLDMYDGRIRYETREGGGASFIIELPPARFTRGQPYHWFAGGTTE